MVNKGTLHHLERQINFFAARTPADYYAYGRWRLGHWLQQNAPRSFEVDTPALFDALDSNKLTAALEHDRNLPRAIAAHFKTRHHPNFFIDTNDRSQLAALISPMEKAATLREADAVLNQVFTFRRMPLRFIGKVDWLRTPQGNVDWRWDLNRHGYFVTLGRAYWYTGDEHYALKYRALLRDWLENNPARTDHPNWESVFEVACRVHAWLWSFYLFRDALVFDTETCLEFLRGVLAHARYLNANIELHVPNNHLLLEAKALACLGILFPEFPEAEKWRRRGNALLEEQVQKQVCADGVHGERATLYHQIIASELLEWLVLLENNALPVSPQMRSTLNSMVDFEVALTKPDGTLPLLGDSALGDTHLRVSAARAGSLFFDRNENACDAPDEATVWLLGSKRITELPKGPRTREIGSRAFAEGGYFVMRAERDAKAMSLVFDCGPFGLKAMPNHGHADALSFDLFAYGRTLVVDPGYYSTSLGERWRNYFRGTRAHNTVAVDELDQSELMDVRRVYRPAQATLHHWMSTPEFDFVDGSHDGYERLAEPITHRRQVFFLKPFYWIVMDWLHGRGEHTFDLFFHLMPDATVALDRSQTLHSMYENQAGLDIVPLAASGLHAEILQASSEPIQGWVSQYAGEKRDAPVLRYRRQAQAPVHFCTVLCPHRADETPSIAVTPLAVESAAPNAESNVLAIQIETEKHFDYFMVDCDLQPKCKRMAQYETDARMLFVRHVKGKARPIQVLQHGGRVLEWNGEPLPWN